MSMAPPPTTGRHRQSRRSPWLSLLASLSVIAVAAIVIAPWDAQRRQAIADQITVWTNPPSAEIEAIADATLLTDDARRVFFASLPTIESAETFNEHCSIEGSTVLGCYAAERIYVFNVTDERLAGTVEVTAVHELMHALYDRLSRSERERIDALVAAAVAEIPETDPVRDVLATYAESQLADEWHARLATEFADLGPELEEHYAQYFEDRQLIVDLNVQSRAALTALEGEIDALVAQIDALGADLETRGTSYEQQLAALNAAIEDFNRRADEGQFESQEQFNSERAALLARSDALEADRVALNSDTERYNTLVAELNALDARYVDLYSQLDSTQAPSNVED